MRDMSHAPESAREEKEAGEKETRERESVRPDGASSTALACLNLSRALFAGPSLRAARFLDILIGRAYRES